MKPNRVKRADGSAAKFRHGLRAAAAALVISMLAVPAAAMMLNPKLPSAAGKLTVCPKTLFDVGGRLPVSVAVQAQAGKHPASSLLTCSHAETVALAGRSYYQQRPVGLGRHVTVGGSRYTLGISSGASGATYGWFGGGIVVYLRNPTGPPAGPSAATVKNAVDAAHAAFAKGRFVPGMAVAVVAPSTGGGLSERTFEFGYANLMSKRRVTPTTQFEIGSETKIFTGALLASAISRRLVSLDDPAQNSLPPGVTAPTSCGASFTFGQLVTHRSGLPRTPPNYGSTPSAHANYTTALLWTGLETTTLLSCPDSTWLYSNFGFGLLGTVLAGVEHDTFGGLVAHELTTPLAMNETELERSTSQLATGYCANRNPAPAWDNTGALAGGGGLISSGRDMGRLLLAELGQGPSSLVGVLQATQHPIANGQGSSQMGMAWEIYSKSGITGPYLYKNGATNGMHSATVIVPSEHVGVTILSNGPTDPSPVVSAIVRQLLGAPGVPNPQLQDTGAGACR